MEVILDFSLASSSGSSIGSSIKASKSMPPQIAHARSYLLDAYVLHHDHRVIASTALVRDNDSFQIAVGLSSPDGAGRQLMGIRHQPLASDTRLEVQVGEREGEKKQKAICWYLLFVCLFVCARLGLLMWRR